MKDYIRDLKQRCVSKLEKTSARIQDTIPYTTTNGKYDDYSDAEHVAWWTNSFWAGIMWRMYCETGEKKYAEYAESIENKIEKVLYGFNRTDHDLGFLWLLTGVERYKQTGNEKAKSNALLAASVLASRFNLKGKYIRAWNVEFNNGIAIIDCMMNLPLLYWASDMQRDDRFYNVAKAHADTVIKYFIRENGSSKHIVRFDPETGEYAQERGGQGYCEGSSWTRGQGWAIYGFIQSYQWTKDKRYLEVSENAAKYFIEMAEKNDYKVKCDFCQPEQDELYDSSAAAIAACGMIELYKETGNSEYLDASIRLIQACDKNFCPWNDEEDEALLNYGCVMYSDGKQMTLIYGDYYFFHAVCELYTLLNENK